MRTLGLDGGGLAFFLACSTAALPFVEPFAFRSVSACSNLRFIEGVAVGTVFPSERDSACSGSTEVSVFTEIGRRFDGLVLGAPTGSGGWLSRFGVSAAGSVEAISAATEAPMVSD